MRKKPLRQFSAPPSKTYPSRPFSCVTCEMEIGGPPTFHVGLAFCCAGCAVSGPCGCSYDERDAARAAAAPIVELKVERVVAPVPERAAPEREPVLAGR